jgi:hypothetical protein
MAHEDTTPPQEFLYESLVIQAYGHNRFSDDVDMPDYDKYIESKQEINETSELKDQIKKHPIANSVYFSGVSEMNELPHQSIEAIKQYLEFQLQLRKNLQNKFNPKPTMI